MKIKNLLFQPLTLHLAVDGEGLHLNAREVREVLADRVSGEIRTAAERGLVSLIRNAGVQVVELPSILVTAASDAETTQKKGNRK